MGKLLHRVAALALILPAAGPALADARLAIPCANGVPCSMEVSGHVDTVGTARLPWTASVVVPAGVCVFAQVTSSDGLDGAAARPVIVTPDGKFAIRRRMGAAVPSTVAGWHTIEVDTPVGAGEQLFTLFLALYPSSTCSREVPPT